MSGARPANAVFNPALRRFLGWAVLLITSGYSFLDYWNYSRTFHEGGGGEWQALLGGARFAPGPEQDGGIPAGGGGEWQALLAGHSFAPAQYRIGVIRAADLLARLTHTHLRHMFAVIDFACLGISLTLLLWLLFRRSGAFRDSNDGGSGVTAQWLQASLALGCLLLYLLWSFWFQKPETHATLLLLVLSAVAAQSKRRVPAVVALIVLAAVCATIRADALIAFHAGFLAACLLPQSRSLPLGRAAQAVASVLSIAAAVGIQFFIMHHVYPNAPRQVAAFQLFGNLKTWTNYIIAAAALFLWWIQSSARGGGA